MPRRDREYDDYEPSPPAKGGFPLWLILVLGGVGLGVIVCTGVSTLAFVIYKQNVARQEVLVEQQMMMAEREQTEVRRDALNAKVQRLERWRDLAGNQVSREEFRSQVAGKTEAEVRDAVGNPDRIDEGPQDSRWRYVGRTYATDPKMLDREAVVVVRDGKVVEVLFE